MADGNSWTVRQKLLTNLSNGHSVTCRCFLLDREFMFREATVRAGWVPVVN